MRIPNFIGGSYSVSAYSVDCQRCVNLYPEINEQRTAANNENGFLRSTPGLTLLTAVGDGPIRGAYFASNNILYVVSGNKAYSVSSSWVSTEIGTLKTYTGLVDFSDNGQQVCIVDVTHGYIWDGTTFTEITSDNFGGATSVGFVDGFFVFARPNCQQFSWSGVYDGLAGDGLDFASAEGAPDNLVGLVVKNREIWLFGEVTTEVFYDSGNPDQTFERIQGSLMEYGCKSIRTAKKLNENMIWLGSGPNSDGVVWMAQGYQPKRISTHAIELALHGAGDIANAYAWVYQEQGHAFYCLQIPGDTRTWCYDVNTGLWHERVNFADGQELQHRASCHAYAYDKHVIGDYANANIYYLDEENYTDNGDVIVRERTSPHQSSELARIIYDSIQLDMLLGSGLDGEGQGTDPQVMLQVSDDAGYTWTAERWAGCGKIGQTLNRAIWRRLGWSRNRVIRVRITDPVKVAIYGMEANVRKASS